MKVYIVRHGQSEGNASHIYQNADTRLNQIGLQQAEFLAKRFESIHLDQIYASSFERAKKTAEIIAESKAMDLEITDELVEIKRPTEIEGKHIHDPEVIRIKKEVHKLFATQEHFSDEENFFDLRSRVQKFIGRINPGSDQSILLVSHGLTIKMLVSLLLFDRMLDPELFVKIIDGWRTENTGITKLFWSGDKWNLDVWNDSAHLGEV